MKLRAASSVAALSLGLLAAVPVCARQGDHPRAIRSAEDGSGQGGGATPTPSATPTPIGALPCVGDCDDDETVSVAELIVGVGMALGEGDLERCPAFDFFSDDRLMIDELVLAVAASNEGCGLRPTATPTATPERATLAEIQESIFTPRCAIIGCHGGVVLSGDLSLEDGQSYGMLVDQVPANAAAADLGLRRVDPGNPDNSFLLVKVEGPDSPALGGRMPVFPPNLTTRQIQLIRDWIAAGAPED
jgi:mono/diheme cytochrome c family protein